MAEVEMLLGAYYMNLDSIWNKLADISEFVDDAEVACMTLRCQSSLLNTGIRSPNYRLFGELDICITTSCLLAGADGPRNGHIQKQHHQGKIPLPHEYVGAEEGHKCAGGGFRFWLSRMIGSGGLTCV